MPAPAVAALVAFLTGTGGGAVAAPWLAPALRADAVIAGVQADLPKVCAATDPLVDALGDHFPRSRALAHVVKVADAVCADAKLPSNPIARARIVVDAINAFNEAAPLAAKAAASEPAPAEAANRPGRGK
ncbi:MAG: hypothetical protein ABSC22_11970 [Roseiarcus sp.]|jgi:hypothetical protein